MFASGGQPSRTQTGRRKFSGGKAWIRDMRADVSDGTIREFVGGTMGAKGLPALFMRYTFERLLRPRAYTGGQFRQMAQGTAFLSVEVRDYPMDFEAILRK